MEAFDYLRAANEDAALREAANEGSAYLAGGTSLVDLMRLGLERPKLIVDVGRLPFEGISEEKGGLFIGSLALNSAVAEDKLVAMKLPALAGALLSGASPQVRNMATVGGNLLQRTRCSYFRDPTTGCNKKTPGAGCPAWEGYNRMHAVLGGTEHCIATNPSDMCVALAALDAEIVTHDRRIPMEDFHLAPGEHPEVETALKKGEFIRGVFVPTTPLAARSRYWKVRDRASFAFALASVAASLEVADGTIHDARIALGGVATKPWRAHEAEASLRGKAPSAETFQAAAAEALRGAAPRRHNAFKVDLAQRAIVRALSSIAELV